MKANDSTQFRLTETTETLRAETTDLKEDFSTRTISVVYNCVHSKYNIPSTISRSKLAYTKTHQTIQQLIKCIIAHKFVKENKLIETLQKL